MIEYDYKILARNEIINLTNNKTIINQILLLIKDIPIQGTKDYKHYPFASDTIESIHFKGDKILLNYKKNRNNTMLFDYCDKHRGFSTTNNKKCHIDLVNEKLKFHLLRINANITYLKNILSKNGNEFNMSECYWYFNQNKYDIKNIILDYPCKNKNIIGYYLNILPISGFFIEKGKIYIADSYLLKYEDGKLNLFCNYKKGLFEKVGTIKSKRYYYISKFNENPAKVTSNNFMLIASNVARFQITECWMENELERTEYKLDSIDSKMYSVTTTLIK